MAPTDTAEPVPMTLAALRLRVGYYTLRDLILRGEVTGFKVDGRWYVTPDSLTRFAEKRSNGHG